MNQNRYMHCVKTQGYSQGFLLALLLSSLFLTGCGQMPSWLPFGNKTEKAEQAQSKGNFAEAIGIYESLLDGTKSSADIHRRLAVIYDSKLKDPVSALHHYRRYLTLQGSQATEEIRRAIARLERDLGNRSTAVSRAEPAAQAKSSPPAVAKPPMDAKGFSTVAKTAAAEQLVGNETRTYKVQKGDTIAAISRKFYKTADRWQDIVDANYNQLNGKPDIREGQTLIIP